MRTLPSCVFLLGVALALLVAGCGAEEPAPDSDAASDTDALTPSEVAQSPPEGLSDLPDGIMPFDDIVIGGQPTEAHLRAANDLGFQTVVNLRPDEEFDEFDQQALVEELGMTYVHIPVAGEEDVTHENAEALSRILEDTGNRPILMHCSSGNRVGSLFAARAHLLLDEDPEHALEIGRRAGLTDLEEPLRDTWTSPGE
ncbi:MAG: protein tyrosine phosphatase family protein [Longimonas sp.]|uniref:protein tyrosine phosphatase family protein n=1 Tax=Longimonas sp. TaxID=2039626 RepID=UPI0033483384